jgi:hypothetical protein
MLINPEKNTKFKEFFEDAYDNIGFLCKQTRKEFKWSVVIDYILLKSLGDDLIKEFLSEKNPDIVDVYMPIAHFMLDDKKFSKTNIVSKRIINKSLYTMREDVDLKILFYLFGGNFFPQEQETYDSTRALYFTFKDFYPNDSGFKNKLEIMKNHLQSEVIGKVSCIAINFGHHWVAVNSIETDIISYNNPLGPYISSKKITRDISENTRFFLFNYSQKNAFILKKNVINKII